MWVFTSCEELVVGGDVIGYLPLPQGMNWRRAEGVAVERRNPYRAASKLEDELIGEAA
jgi:hypothetical protein